MSTPEILPQLDRPQLCLSLSLREDLWCRPSAWAVALWSRYLLPPFLECIPSGLLSSGWITTGGIMAEYSDFPIFLPSFLTEESLSGTRTDKIRAASI